MDPVKLSVGISELTRANFSVPTIIAYNRLETRSRTTDFDRSLKAEIRDPLWMIARQWQFGEFQGEDAASQSTSRILFDHQHVDQIEINGASTPYIDSDMPLETVVEREKIPLTTRTGTDGKIYSDLLFGTQMGLYFLKSLEPALHRYKAIYLQKYSFLVSDEDVEATLVVGSIGRKMIDGCVLYTAIVSGAHAIMVTSDVAFDINDRQALITLGTQFADYFTARFSRIFAERASSTSNAWLSGQLEYQFKVSAPAVTGLQLKLSADSFHSNHLDWYNFDAATIPDQSQQAAVDNEQVESFIPNPVHFKGMPSTRFWEIDDAQLDFGKIDTSPTGLFHLMLAEFGLTYSNDWYVLPHPMPVNNICEIKDIMVTNVFGEDTLIRPAGKSAATYWHKWSMFNHTHNGAPEGQGNIFYLVPGVGKIMKSDPIEKVNYIRDEMAQMAWAIENIVSSQMANGLKVRSVVQNATQNLILPGASTAGIQYTLGNLAPSNWTPFIPVQINDQSSEIRLQRARMITGAAPKGVLLTEKAAPYFINEEEITRAGAIVSRSYKRCRWFNGKTLLWVGREKETGRGGGWGGLRYDQISDIG